LFNVLCVGEILFALETPFHGVVVVEDVGGDFGRNLAADEARPVLDRFGGRPGGTVGVGDACNSGKC
jgi:hypothetical protein